MEENLDEFDYMIINVESCINGSLKVTPKIPQTLAEIVTFGKGYIRIGDEN